MRRNLSAFSTAQVFLNYPFDEDFQSMADAMSFSVVAAGMIPVCAKDLSVPDRPRLDMLMEAINHCQYSAHDFSRFTGEGARNLARMNMPLEMGIALYHALNTQRHEHRCAFFVPTEHDYHAFASDLSGLDPLCHVNNDDRLVNQMYEWLRSVVDMSYGFFNSIPTVKVLQKYKRFKKELLKIKGSGDGEVPSHEERRELMYQICSKAKWWDWRVNRFGSNEFREIPLAWK